MLHRLFLLVDAHILERVLDAPVMQAERHLGDVELGGVYRYLTKNGRALARDFLNIDAPEEEGFDLVSL